MYMTEFYQIKSNSAEEQIINKSRFIALSFCLQSRTEVDEILQKLKAEYRDSTHICYAYRLMTGEEKCSDDGEPQGTAGLPILDVIKKNDIANILLVVVRYFGGVKLGAGGLVRAYSSTASNCIEKSGKTQVVGCKKITFSLPIFQSKFIKIIEKLEKIKKIDVKYGENIQISIYSEVQNLENIKTQICNILAESIEFYEESKIYFIGE